MRATCRRLGIVPGAVRDEIDRSALTGGFGRYPHHLRTLCAHVEEDVGLRIDPIFGGKAWWVMERMRPDQRVREPCLYWHCGFTPEWQQLANAVHRGPSG